MSFARYRALPLAAIVIMAPLRAQAEETGEIRGVVTGPDGAPVSGVEIVLSGPGVAGEIEVFSNSDGTYKFIALPPGEPTVRYLADGFEPVTAAVTVRLGQSTYVPIALVVADDTIDVITVEERQPVIDATQSGFSASLGKELLQNLPVGRSYQEAVNMLPGVYGRVDTSQGGPGDGNPSVRGEGQYGNNFLVDGVSTRDPSTKTFGTNVNFDAIEDIKVYTDGAPAEYGQFAGMLVNVVTKDGGDEHHGSVGYWLDTDASFGKYDIADLGAHLNVPTSKRDFLAHSVSLTAGGPIAKEKLWYFGALDLGDSRAIYEGMDPLAPNHGQDANGFLKLSWFPTPDLTFRAVVNFAGSRTDNNQTSSQFLPESQSQRRTQTTSILLESTYHPDASTEIELKGGWMQTDLNEIPQSGSEDLPSIFDKNTGQYLNNWTDYDLNTRGRLGGGITATRVVTGFGGDHKFKAGIEYWRGHDQRELRYTGAGEGVSYVAYDPEGPDNYPCVAADFSDCWAKTTYKEVGPLGHAGLIGSAFIQDDWTLFHRLTINIGGRVDRETLMHAGSNDGSDAKSAPVTMDDPSTPQDDKIPYRMMMPAPRLGLAWDVTGDSKTLISGFAGQYYDIAGNGLAEWGDTRSAYDYTQFCNDQRTDLACTTAGQDVGDPQYLQTHHQDPVANPSTYSSTLKPARMDKVTVGFEREVATDLSFGVRGILSRTVNIPEDVNVDDSSYFIEPSAQKRRDYKGLELTAEKKFNDRWQLLAAYTLSSAKGETPGQFEVASGGSIGSDGNNVGVYLDDVSDPTVRADYFAHPGRAWSDGAYLNSLAGLGYNGNTAGWYGYLPYHSFHAVKINGSYTFPVGTTLGLVYELDSGHAWQRRTYVPLYEDYYGFGEGRGTRFMPPVNYIDVRVAQKFEMKANREIELTLDIFNLPDLKTPVTYYENDDQNFGLVLYRQSPRAIRAGIRGTY